VPFANAVSRASKVYQQTLAPQRLMTAACRRPAKLKECRAATRTGSCVTALVVKSDAQEDHQ
jgi:hypothetical protein